MPRRFHLDWFWAGRALARSGDNGGMDLFGWIASLPRWQMYAAFLAVAVGRGFGYYLTGVLGGARVRGARWFDAQERVRRLGARAVVVTWPVYGLAGATQVAAGAARVGLPGFTAALVTMSAIWAGLQTAVGVVVLEALATRAAPFVLLVILALLVGRLVLDRCRGRREVVTGA